MTRKQYALVIALVVLVLSALLDARREPTQPLSFANHDETLMATQLSSADDAFKPLSFNARPTQPSPPLAITARVKRVIDGDTIELEDGARVRYIGVDTPETVHPRKQVECFGKEAKERNRQLVEGKRIRLEKDISNTDRYGRLLRYVAVDTTFVNELLIREGYALPLTIPPDVSYAERFRALAADARRERRGLWGACR